MTSRVPARPTAVIGAAASAGGVEALRALVSRLPAGLPATILVVLHIPPAGPTVLPQILSRAGQLPARHPRDGEPLPPGVILVAPPNRHLAVADGRARLLAGARENGHRPSGDILLRSLAENCGTRCAGAVLSGTMDDGAAGLAAVRRMGGLALVQEPAEAAFPAMPLAAIKEANPQFVGPVDALADRLRTWLAGLGPGGSGPDTTAAAADDPLERALWAAVVALEERIDLCWRIIQRLERSGRSERVDAYRTEIAVSVGQAKLLREVISDLIKMSPAMYHDGAEDGDPG